MAINPWQRMNGMKDDDLKSLMASIYQNQGSDPSAQSNMAVLPEIDQQVPPTAPIDGSRIPASESFSAIDPSQVQKIQGMEFGPPTSVSNEKEFVGPVQPKVAPIIPSQSPTKDIPRTGTMWMGTPDVNDGISLAPLMKQEKGSGLSQEEKAKQLSDASDGSRRMLSMSPAEFQTAYDNIASTPMYKDQQKGIDQLRQMAALSLQRPTQTDLSPLVALTDSWTGSHLMPGYQRPETGDQQLQQAMAAAEKIQGAQKDLSANVLNTITKENGGYLTQMQRDQIINTLDAKSMDPTMKANLYRPVNAFMTQTRAESSKMLEGDQQLQKVLVAVNSGNPAEQKGVPLMIARLIEGARPAMAAAAVESGDPSLIERLSAMGQKLSSGTLTAENVGQYSKFIHDMQKVSDQAKSGLVKRWTTSGTEMGLTPEAIQGMIPPAWLNAYSGSANQIMNTSPKPQNVVKPGTNKQPPSSSGSLGISPEAIAAEAKRRAALKAGQ